MENVQHPTSNLQRPVLPPASRFIGFSMFGSLVALFLAVPLSLPAQTQPPVPSGGLIQLQVAQPPVNTSGPVTATAVFDPPTARVGEKVFYRVTVGATESSIRWPERISAPPGLNFSANARGQILEPEGNKFHPVTVFLYELRAPASGAFVVSNFVVAAYGRPLEIPEARLDVVVANSPAEPPPRRLLLKVSTTNVFVGQPFRVRVMLPAAVVNGADEIEALREVQLNGNGFMTDKTVRKQAVEPVTLNGGTRPAFIYETTVTPIAAGALKLSAQGFSAGRDFGGPISISGRVILPGGPPKYDFLVSDAVDINVRPLPDEGRLPGFTGSVGRFIAGRPWLSTNRLHVGQPVQLNFAIHNVGGLARFVPPRPPFFRDWQILAGNPPDSGFTLIPLTDDPQTTPAIPFSAFNPGTGRYVNLTIPPMPVTITGKGLPVNLGAPGGTGEAVAPSRLSGLAPAPGWTVASLKPPQLRGWLVGAQFVPVLGLVALWQWDRRRRFLETHPQIVRCRRARRALRRKKRELQNAAATGDAAAFVRHAADAMKIACAPHLPAHPQALVCADVLAQLDGTDQNGRAAATVRRIFAAADAQFAATPQAQADLLALRSDTDTVLLILEEKL